MAAHHTGVSTPSLVSGGEAFVEKLVKERETIARLYIAIISPDLLAMLQLRQYGDCTVDDPRACLNYHANGADLACIMFANMSVPQFEAMILNNMFINKTRVVLHCTEFDSYVFVVAENRVPDKDKCKDTVELMIRNMKTEQGRCRPGVEMLGPDYWFTQPPTFHRSRRIGGDGSQGGGKRAMYTTTYIMSARRFAKYMQSQRQHFECQRTMQNGERKEFVCRPGLKRKEATATPFVAHPIIHGAWMLMPDTHLLDRIIVRP